MLQTIRTPHASLGSALIALAACGGGDPLDPDTAAASDRAQAQAATPLLFEPIAITSPTIASPPRDARVGVGSGVRFGVLATGFAPFTYRWFKNGVAIAGAAGAGSSHEIGAAALADAGNYTVRVADRFGATATSAAAVLTVVQADWAPLGGRLMVSSTAPQQPALALCNGPVVAWVQTDAAGVGTLAVWRFSGTVWQPLGNALNTAAGVDAREPSIDCLRWGDSQRPVVAFSEASGNGRTIVVKAWDGAAWQQTVAVGTTAGAQARKPVLRIAPDRGDAAQPVPLRSRSALAWVENGSARAKLWNGIAWQPYAGGFPSGTNLPEVALALDRSVKSGTWFTHPPLIAAVHPQPAARFAVGAQANVAGWGALGQPTSTGVSDPLLAKQIAGIGFSSDNSGPGHAATVVWFDSSAAGYTISSRQLLGMPYDSALANPLAPQPPWGAFARPRADAGLRSWSFDADEFVTQCFDGASRPTFALAVNDRRGSSVLSALCTGREADALEWTARQAPIAGEASGLSLRMERLPASVTPVLAVARSVNDRHELTVHRFFP